jgi:hypothetical protein
MLFCVGNRVLVWKVNQRPNPQPTVCTSIEPPYFECEPPRLSGLALSNITCLAIVGSGGEVRGRNHRNQKGRGGAENIQTLHTGFSGGG